MPVSATFGDVNPLAHETMGPEKAVMVNDLKAAFRTVRRSPGFAAAAVISLALGIGANTAIFTLADALLFRPLPVPAPEQLVRVQSVDARAQAGLLSIVTPMVDAIRDAGVFANVCGLLTPLGTMEVDGRVRSVSAVVTSGDCFGTLGVHAALGRLLAPEDDRAGAAKVADISYQCWLEEFGGRHDVIGRTIRLGSDPYTIVGVLERGFDGVLVGFPARVYSSLHQLTVAGLPISAIGQLVVARLKPGDAATNVLARLAAEWPAWLAASVPSRLTGAERERYLARRPTIESAATGFSEFLRTRFARPLIALLVISGLVLLIASINVANLLPARAANRRHDLAVRRALGATRWRLARAALLESAMVLIVATAAGVVVAWAADRVLVTTFQATSQTFALAIAPDARVLIFTACAAALAFLIAAVGPVLHSTDVDPSTVRGAGAGVAPARGRARRVVLVAQVSLTLVLVAVGSLFVAALGSLERAPLDIDPDRLLTVQLAPLPGGYPNGVAPPAYYRGLLERLGADPAVASVALSADDPFVTVRPMIEVRIDDADAGPVSAEDAIVTEAFFDTMRIPIVEGRGFRPSDGADAAVVSETLARQLFGTASPLGHVVRAGDFSPTLPLHIIGVARDAVLSRPQAHNTSIIYNGFWGGPEFFSTLVVRMRADPVSVVAAVRTALAREGHEYPNRIDTVTDSRDAALAQERLLASLSSAYAGLGLVLAAVGLYGLLIFSVAARTAEIGVRMALGASPGRVVGLVLRDAGSLMAAGVAIGTPSAWAAANAASRLLTGVPRQTATPILTATLLMIGVAALATWLPARRAASVDPIRALKCE